LTRRTILVLVLIVGLGAAGAAVVLFTGSPDDEAGEPERGTDLGEEQGRIEQAREAFARHLSDTPLMPRSYLVSFGDPVSVAELLGSLEDEGSPVLELESGVRGAQPLRPAHLA